MIQQLSQKFAKIRDLCRAQRAFNSANHSATGSIPSLPIATVGALILNEEGKLLMLRTQKWSDLWGIPGGKIRFGEPSVTALRREIKEETGLEIVDIRFVMVQDCIHSTEFFRDAHFLLLNYLCKAPSGQDVVLNAEAQQYRWVSPNTASGMALNTPTRRLLEAVYEGGGLVTEKNAKESGYR